ncbi:hypothetical protein AB0B50_09640 [Streptomyces sp. NPDC041068]|uniref:hypothetical protein n=1 Tax=Streptomyces sp. NPDC041068 TaxID=3155130 RepID=UPI0033D6E00B
MRKRFLGCVAALVCGVTVLGPLPAAAAEPPPSPNAMTERELKNQARTFHSFGRTGHANATVSTFAGDVLQGQMKPEKVRQGLAKVDASLDNLLAIIPGGPPGQRVANPILKATVEAIKKETRKMAEARARTDYPALLAAGTALTTQLSLLTAQSFAGFGIDLAQQIVGTVLQPLTPTPQPPQQRGAS